MTVRTKDIYGAGTGEDAMMRLVGTWGSSGESHQGYLENPPTHHFDRLSDRFCQSLDRLSDHFKQPRVAHITRTTALNPRSYFSNPEMRYLRPELCLKQFILKSSQNVNSFCANSHILDFSAQAFNCNETRTIRPFRLYCFQIKRFRF